MVEQILQGILPQFAKSFDPCARELKKKRIADQETCGFLRSATELTLIKIHVVEVVPNFKLLNRRDLPDDC